MDSISPLGVVAKTGTDDVILGHDAFERRLNHFLRRGRDHVKHEPVAVDVFQQMRQQADVLFQPDALPDLDQVLFADAAVLRVVEQQVGEFSSLLHQANFGQAFDPFCKSRCADQLAQHDPRIVEAERLIEIAHQQIVLLSVLQVAYTPPLKWVLRLVVILAVSGGA